MIITFTLITNNFINSQNNIKKNIIINLGQDCEVTYYLKKLKLREIALPLDWLQTYNFDGICKLIEEDYEFFLDQKYLVYNFHSVSKQTRIHNTRYDLYFVHDFPTEFQKEVSKENGNFGKIVPNFLDYLDQVKNKYKNRIKRFKDILLSDNNLYFIRTHIGPVQAYNFVKLIKKKYPKLNFTLIIVNNVNNLISVWQSEHLIKNWNIPNTKNFFINKIEKITGNKWGDLDSWKEIFKNLVNVNN